MENRINVASLLKDCPKGMELDCTAYNDVTFLHVDESQNRCYFKAGPADTFWTTCYGHLNYSPKAKCVIFPKGKTTWEGFQRPFKEGYVLVPFESKVLVRNTDKEIWKPAIFGCCPNNKPFTFFALGGCTWRCCIPYNDNEHLLGTTKDCEDRYKLWLS